MKTGFLKFFLGTVLSLVAPGVFGQVPTSICAPSGGKRANVLSVETKYRAPGGAAPTFTIPAGTKSIAVYVSSETGLPTGGADNDRGDEDFITINAIIDVAGATSSGYVNYAKNTNKDGSGTNVYGWKNIAIGTFIPDADKLGDKDPDLNNVNFQISGSTLTITEGATAMADIHSSYYVEYLSPLGNSLNPLTPEIRGLLHGASSANTDLEIPIPTGTNIIFISGKGTNSSASELNTGDGSEEGYMNSRFYIDLDANLTDGFVTVANGGTANRRSTYVIEDLSSAFSSPILSSLSVSGDYASKSVAPGGVGVYNPQIYVSGGNLYIKREANYARDFDDAYIIEFYTRVGSGMSAEFIDSDVKDIPKGLSSNVGVARTFKIPSGTNFVYFNQTGNAINTDRESNENGTAAYAYIDLTNKTATGYYYQQVGLSGTNRRDDNFAFKDVPLTGVSTKAASGTVGWKISNDGYDISFELSADGSELTVVNKTGLANPDYQFLLSADFYGARPDVAFNIASTSFSKIADCDFVRTTVTLCNPGSGNNNGGMPISFYDKDPTVEATAKLLYTGTLSDAIIQGNCEVYNFDINLSAYTDKNIALYIVANDNGSFVTGGVGSAVGSTFSLSDLRSQGNYYIECDYTNNLMSTNIVNGNCPEASPDLNSVDEDVTLTVADGPADLLSNDSDPIDAETIQVTSYVVTGESGTPAIGTAFNIAGKGSITINANGSYTFVPATNFNGAVPQITYTITDASGGTSSSTLDITVNPINDAPVGTDDTGTVTEDQTLTVTTASGLLSNDTDLDGDALTVSKYTIAGVAGDQSVGSAVTISSVGEITINSDGSYSFTPAANYTGAIPVITYTLSDGTTTDEATLTLSMTPVNDAPVGTDDTGTVTEDQTLTVTTASGLLSNDTDLDGDALTVSKYTIAGVAGDQSVGSAVTISSVGEITINSDGSYSFTPAANYTGAIPVITYTLSDGTATDEATLTLSMTPINDAPVGTDDTGTVTEDQTLTVTTASGLLSNDTDLDGDALTVSKYTIAGIAGDQSVGSAVTISSVGEITINSDGSYSFTPAANYTGAIPVITYTLSDGTATDEATLMLSMTPVNDDPTAVDDAITVSEDSGATIINVLANDSSIPDSGETLTVSSVTQPVNGTVTLTAGVVSFTPAPNFHGTTTFDYTISDGNGGTATATVTVTVTPVNDAPVGTDDTGTVTEDQTLTVTTASGLLSNDTDPDGDALTVSKYTIAGVAGDQSVGSAVTISSVGEITINSDGSYSFTPAANYTGAIPVITYTLSDGTATDEATLTLSMTPVNDDPTAVDDAITVSEDSGATIINVLANDSSTPDSGETLTVSSVTQPANGTVTLTAGVVSFTPAPNFHGTTTFDYTISDGNGGTATATVNVTVTPVNDAPVGTDDTGTVTEDQTLTVTTASGLLSNDTDLDGDALTVSKYTIAGIAGDQSVGSAVTISSVGEITINSDGSYSFTPAANYTGAIPVITYTLSDGTATDEATLTLSMTPVNDAPVGTDDTGTVTEDQTLTVTTASGLLSNDTDLDGDALTVSKYTIAGIAGDQSVGSAVTISSVGEITINSDGSYSFTPAANYTGAIPVITYTLSDGTATDEATLTLSMTPVNDDPTAVDDAITVSEDSGATIINVLANDSSTPDSGETLTVSSVTQPANGTVTLTAGVVSFTPAPNFHGTTTFDYTISDGNGGTATATVNVTVTPVNDAPVGTPDSPTTPEDTPVEGQVTGTDPDGDVLIYTKGTDPSHGTVLVKADGTYTYTPHTNYNGPDSFDVIISDGNGGTIPVTVNVTVTPVNDDPTGTADPITTTENTPVNGDIEAFDNDGDELTYTLNGGPDHGTVTVDPVTGGYTYDPDPNYNGPDSFDVIITDDNGGSATVTVNVTVTANPLIGISKTATEPKLLLNGSYEITYNLNVRNMGSSLLSNVQVSDDLNAVFSGVENYSVMNVTATHGLVVNPGFNGWGDPELLAAGNQLAFNSEANISVTVRVLPGSKFGVFSNTATAKAVSATGGIATSDVSTVGNNPDPNGNGKPDDAGESEPTTITLNPTEVIVPEGFSPNGDGVNDLFVIENTGSKRLELEIYNRWGNVVYKNPDYKNDWDGRANRGVKVGDDVPDGTYYYIIIVEGKKLPVKFITINR